MYHKSGLVPIRFLILISHFAICVILLWISKESAKSCLSEILSESIRSHRTELVAGLSVAIALLCLELLAFLFGLTMFNDNSAYLSMATHSLATVWLGCVVLDQLEVGWFWWIFSFGSVIPFLNDVVVVLDVLINKKY